MEIAFLKPTSKYICVIMLIICTTTIMAEMDTDVPMGWAVVPSSVGRPPVEELSEADIAFYTNTMPANIAIAPTWKIGGIENTIGGGNGRMVKASGDEVKKYAFMDEPLVIVASGTVGNFQVKSHKTIVGAGEGLTVKGQVTVDGVKNVILRNLKISGGNDAISIAWGSNHIWVDHCDVSNCGDGLIDMKRGVDRITISWVRTSNHHKTMLINHGNADPNVWEVDVNRLNVTLHHMFWDGSRTRNPRVGFGQVHILNCYYNANSGYGIHTFKDAEVRIEKNYFKNVGDAVSDHGGGSWPGVGYIVLIDNHNENSGIKKKPTTDPDRMFDVDKVYLYDLVVTDDATQVPDVVQSGAGNGAKWGRIGAIPTPGQGCVSVSIDPILKWTKVGSEGPIPKTSTVYFGKTNPPPEVAHVEGYSYKPGKLDDATVYYWKINDGKVWKFRTDAKVTSINYKKQQAVKNVISKKTAPVLKIGSPGKSSHFIGVRDGKNQNNFYLMNGKQVIKGTKTQASTDANVKKEVAK